MSEKSKSNTSSPSKESKKIINKGTGAGGANATLSGGSFEKKTSLEDKLIEKKFIKHIMNKSKNGYYYEKKESNYNIIYFNQNGFNKYVEKEYSVQTYRKPDEAIIIENDDNVHIIILEKKNQNVDGSVEEKLKTGAFTRREYEIMFSENKKYKFKISFCFVLSKFLQNKFESDIPKYINMKKIMKEDKIKYFFGDSKTYIDDVYDYIINNCK